MTPAAALPRAGRARRAAALLVASGLGLLACSSGQASTVETSATEDAVAEKVAAGLGPELDEVRCPAEIERAVGATVECRAVLAEEGTSEPGQLRVEVRQVDDEGRLDVEPLDAVIDRSEVALDLEDTLTDAYDRDFTIDCGGGLDVVAPGGTITCDAADAFERRTIVVTITDVAGTVLYDVDGDGDGGDDGGGGTEPP
ncbi:hypothetical protein BH23ACT2_BH23ACT2_25510 [soil metagenome]